MPNSKNIIVTGGAGFIGSAMVRHLIEQTDNKVLNIDCLSYSGNLSSLSDINKSSRYSFIKSRIGDNELIRSSIKDFKPNIIINFAAESHVDRSIDNPYIFFKTNVMETLNFLTNIKDYINESDSASKDFLFHHISTDEVYGDLDIADHHSLESDPYKPSSPYAASKASSDHLVKSFSRTYGLPIKITNCSNNYGPYQFPEKLIPLMILKALKGHSLPIYGDGSQIRDWLYVNDHIEAILNVIDYGKPGECYNIGGGNQITNLEVVNLICESLDQLKPSPNKNKYSSFISFTKDRPGHDKRYAINASKIMNDCKWVPKHNFKEGLFQTVKWYLDNLDWCDEILSSNYNLTRLGN